MDSQPEDNALPSSKPVNQKIEEALRPKTDGQVSQAQADSKRKPPDVAALTQRIREDQSDLRVLGPQHGDLSPLFTPGLEAPPAPSHPTVPLPPPTPGLSVRPNPSVISQLTTSRPSASINPNDDNINQQNYVAGGPFRPPPRLVANSSELGGGPLLKKRKPVIYLFSPVDIDATVRLSLAVDWTFSSIYPMVPVESLNDGEKRGESLEWNVQTNSNDGTLLEKNLGLAVSSLFWEADARPLRPESPPSTPVVENAGLTEKFNAASADLWDCDSVLLPSREITGYLERALKAMSLHVEARTSFITFWLPYFQKYAFIAIRFLPQHSLDLAAPLAISPKPDVITRVFMLFKGVSEDAVSSDWAVASARASEGVEIWQGIVGIDVEKCQNVNLFRVLEWGGMEVQPRV